MTLLTSLASGFLALIPATALSPANDVQLYESAISLAQLSIVKEVPLDTFAQGDLGSGSPILGPWTPPGKENWIIHQEKCIANTDAWNLGCGPTDEIERGNPHEVFFSFKASALEIHPENYDVLDIYFDGAPDANFDGVQWYIETLMDPSFAGASSAKYVEFIDSDRTEWVLAEAGLEKRITSPIETVCTWGTRQCLLDVTDLFYETPGKLLPTLDMSGVVILVNILHTGVKIPALSKTVKLRVSKVNSNVVELCKSLIALDPGIFRYTYCWRRCDTLQQNNCPGRTGDDLIKCMVDIFTITGTAACLSGGKGCTDDPCVASADCHSTFGGGAECVCLDGKYGDGLKTGNGCDGNPEGEIDKCKGDKCVPEANCKLVGGQETCVCPPPTKGDGLKTGTGCNGGTHECKDDLCVPEATCEISPSGEEQCLCPPGMQGDGTKTGDGCSSGSSKCTADCVPDAICEVFAGGQEKCLCPEGMSGDGLIGGTGCSTGGDLLCVEPCADNADCKADSNGNGKCTCPEGMVGDGLEAGTGCGDGGTTCGLENCSVGAECKPDVSGQVICTCPNGMEGDGLKDGTGCSAGVLCGGATCVASATCTADQCTCPDDLIGDGTLSGSGCEVDPCDADCSPNATCMLEQDLVSCVCKGGYEGNGNVCVEVEKCSADKDCGTGATCVNIDNKNTCVCPGGIQQDGACHGTYQYTLAPNSTIKIVVPNPPKTLKIDVGKCVSITVDIEGNFLESRFVSDSTNTDVIGDFTGDITFLIHRDEHTVSTSMFSHSGLAEGNLFHPYEHCRFGQIIVHGFPDGYDASDITASVTENLAEVFVPNRASRFYK